MPNFSVPAKPAWPRVPAALGAVFSTAVLSACITVHPTVPAGAAPTAATGYVAGVFSARGHTRYAFGLTKEASNAGVIMPFFDPPKNKIVGDSTYKQEQVTLVELPAGAYRIDDWMTYSADGANRKALNEPLRFSVRPGKITYIGKYTISERVSFLSVETAIEAFPISRKDLSLFLQLKYPAFSTDMLEPVPGTVNDEQENL